MIFLLIYFSQFKHSSHFAKFSNCLINFNLIIIFDLISKILFIFIINSSKIHSYFIGNCFKKIYKKIDCVFIFSSYYIEMFAKKFDWSGRRVSTPVLKSACICGQYDLFWQFFEDDWLNKRTLAISVAGRTM